MNCYKCATPLPDNSRFCLSCGADVSGEHPHAHDKTIAVEADPELMTKLQEDIGTEYVLDRELGRGGMAIVYLGHDAQLGRKVAVKLLPPELTYAAGKGVIDRFKREARTSATLDHPNIIPVYRVSQGQKLFWYVMKFLEGESLDHILERDGQLPVDRVAAILKQTADALDYAHQHQVIHRDIKPANLMIDAKGRVTVTDFGIAKALDANTLTATGSMIGTPYYMSPEQCSGKRVGPASDQYSLAVMAYQMLGGHVPFTGESLIDIVRKHCMDPVPPLGVLRPNLPASLIAVVEKALAKTPEERFATAMEFATAFEVAAKGLAVDLSRPSQPARQRLSKTALVSPIPGALRTASGKVGGGRRAAMIAGAVVVLGGGGAALAILKPWAGTGAAPVASLPADSPRVAVPPAAEPGAGAAKADSGAAADTGAATAAAPPASGTATTTTRLTLRGVPRGATVTRNGARMRSNTMTVEPNRPQVIRIDAPGYEVYLDTVRLTPGQTRTLAVNMRRAATQTTAAAPPAAQPQPAPAQPGGRPATPPSTPTSAATPPANVPAPAPATPPAAAATGTISLFTNPRSAVYIGSQPVGRYPVLNYQVPAGTLRLRFQVSDSTGLWWARDVVVQVAPGEVKRLGTITLERP
jgi:serine/threonine-protein kinase